MRSKIAGLVLALSSITAKMRPRNPICCALRTPMYVFAPMWDPPVWPPETGHFAPVGATLIIVPAVSCRQMYTLA
jgi:hypothetical protein